jgi:hypothetical protein
MISTGDKIRIALAPAHMVVGAALVAQFFRGLKNGTATPMVLVLGVLLIAYGVYRVALVRRAFKRRPK